MNIQILQLIEGAKQAKGLTVIIDVFRAFSVEAYLINNHAKYIIPVGKVDEAYNYKKDHPEYILIGERHGKILPGFDYGNSPSSIENVDFTDQVIIHTTSAGTQGVANAIGAKEIITGSLVNAEAIVKYIKWRNPTDVSLVCMGLEAKEEVDEDTLCARYIQARLLNQPFDLDTEIEKLKTTSGAKFFDPTLQDIFPQKDFELSTRYNRFNFVIRLEDEQGIKVMKRVNY